MAKVVKVKKNGTFTVHDPFKMDGRMHWPILLKGSVSEECSISIDFPDGDENDGGVLVTASFYISREARKRNRLQKVIDSLRG